MRAQELSAKDDLLLIPPASHGDDHDVEGLGRRVVDLEAHGPLTRHHVGGHLKVAPEHTDAEVLDRMRKPANDDFEEFTRIFDEQSRAAGKTQHIVPY